VTQTTNDDERLRAVIEECAVAMAPLMALDPDRRVVIHLLGFFAPGVTLSDGADGQYVTGRVGCAVVSVRVSGLRAVMSATVPEPLAEPVVAEFARAVGYLPDPLRARPVIQPPELSPPGKRLVDFLGLRPEHVAWILTRLPELTGERS
jgi:hypothetical protein